MESQVATSEPLSLNRRYPDKFVDSCRICMVHKADMSDIFEAESGHIINEILFCTGVTLLKEDGFPTKICAPCLKDLTIAYKFKTSCIFADKTFRDSIVNTSIKSEASEVSDVNFEENIDYEDGFEEEVKVEVPWEPGIQNPNKKVQKDPQESIVPTEPPKRVGRPRSTTTPRRLKKYKFKKLHCESCDIKFNNKQQCDEHRKTEHKDDDTWVCEICGKLFLHRASHYSHVKSHLPPQYACDQCDYKTWHKYDLVKHIRIHTGIKMYQCEYCTASYYTSSNLKMHIRRNHIKERRFECNICRRTFFDRTKLNRHLDSHNEIKRFECEVCHACFTRRCYWKKHLLRQHDIVTPPQRPGRQKTNSVVGEDLTQKVNLVLTPCVPEKYLAKICNETFVIERVNEV